MLPHLNYFFVIRIYLYRIALHTLTFMNLSVPLQKFLGGWEAGVDDDETFSELYKRWNNLPKAPNSLKNNVE